MKSKKKKLNLVEEQRQELQGMPWVGGAVCSAVEPRAVAAAVNSKCTFHLQENGTLAKI